MPANYKRFLFLNIFLGVFVFTSNVRGQDIVLKDDFDSKMLSSIWSTSKISKKGLRHVTCPSRNGNSAIEISLFPGDKSATGGDGQQTERAELREVPDVRLSMGVESWYAISFFLPADFPIVDNRLVIASWKQSFKESWKDRNPMVSLRYMAGKLRINVERDRGQRTVYMEEIDLRNQWTDMVFHIIPKASKKLPKYFKDGLLEVWKNNRKIVTYQGALGFINDEEQIYFRMGLYRDHMQIPMRIIFDRFRRGTSLEAVSIYQH